jgi:uncharacterized membrane protein
MSEPQSRWSDHAVEQLIGRLLQFGVLLAAVVVLAGAILLLAQHGGGRVSYGEFRGEPEALRSLGGIVRGVFTGDSIAIVQFGLLLLILTPVARVALTLVAFLLQRDRTFVVVTTIVLALLLYGLLLGRA